MAITGISYASYAYAAATQSFGAGAGGSASGNQASSSSTGTSGVNGSNGVSDTGQQLSQDQQQEVTKLKATDDNVRKHEQAHLAVAGGLATSGASYTYQRGPDGKSYAVGGEVSIDVSPGNTPEETIKKAEQIQRAALAPADPSGQDRSVAAQAASMEADARAKLVAASDLNGGNGNGGTAATSTSGSNSSGSSISSYYSSNGGNRYTTASGLISAYA
ncbi:MAG: hypothetical protein JO142_16990 [Burkholderiales bacterium]|nr:hypothetical protein [Burkholderiales bacterium]